MSDRTQQPDQERRRFMGTAAAAAMTVTPGLALFNVATARPADQPVSSDQRWGMLVDAGKCADGCTACVQACNQENGIQPLAHGDPETASVWIRKVRLRDRETGKETNMPLMCQHCEHPPCVDVCPTGASFKRKDGIVLVDRHICIGCRYCMMACPYKARSLVHEELTDQKPYMPRGKGCVESCTLCMHRVDAGNLKPACVEACEAEGHKALVFGDLKDPDSELYQLLTRVPSTQIREDLNLNTGVRYHGV